VSKDPIFYWGIANTQSLRIQCSHALALCQGETERQTMNAKQTQAIRTLTTRIDRANRLRNGETLNGDVTFTVEVVAPDFIMVSASNSGACKWYESHIFVLATIGPRGGVKLRNVEGVCL
jgi:hypothetical protein